MTQTTAPSSDSPEETDHLGEQTARRRTLIAQASKMRSLLAQIRRVHTETAHLALAMERDDQHIEAAFVAVAATALGKAEEWMERRAGAAQQQVDQHVFHVGPRPTGHTGRTHTQTTVTDNTGEGRTL